MLLDVPDVSHSDNLEFVAKGVKTFSLIQTERARCTDLLVSNNPRKHSALAEPAENESVCASIGVTLKAGSA